MIAAGSHERRQARCPFAAWTRGWHPDRMSDLMEDSQLMREVAVQAAATGIFIAAVAQAARKAGVGHSRA